jgi:hypothetical protein
VSERDDAQPELRELDRRLREIAFAPRASLGPEILGRLRRGEPAGGTTASPRRRRVLASVAAALLAVTAGALLLRSPG